MGAALEWATCAARFGIVDLAACAEGEGAVEGGGQGRESECDRAWC